MELDFKCLMEQRASGQVRSGQVLPALSDGAGEQWMECTDNNLLQDVQSLQGTTLHESRWLESARGASSPHCGSPHAFYQRLI